MLEQDQMLAATPEQDQMAAVSTAAQEETMEQDRMAAVSTVALVATLEQDQMAAVSAATLVALAATLVALAATLVALAATLVALAATLVATVSTVALKIRCLDLCTFMMIKAASFKSRHMLNTLKRTHKLRDSKKLLTFSHPPFPPKSTAPRTLTKTARSATPPVHLPLLRLESLWEPLLLSLWLLLSPLSSSLDETRPRSSAVE